MYKRPSIRKISKSANNTRVSVDKGWVENFLKNRGCGKAKKVATVLPKWLDDQSDFKGSGVRISDFRIYRRNFVRNEREIMAKCGSKYQSVFGEYMLRSKEEYRKFLLKKVFLVWSGKCDHNLDYFYKWQSDYRRVLRLVIEVYIRQRRVYMKSMYDLVDKIVLHEKYDFLKKVFEIWKGENTVTKEPLPVYENPMAVELSKKKVSKKSGKEVVVKCKPLGVLHEKYYSKGVRAPIDEKVRAYHQLGYPVWFLETMILARDKKNRQKPAMEEFIHHVFDKYMSKGKGSTPKPKTIQQRFK